MENNMQLADDLPETPTEVDIEDISGKYQTARICIENTFRKRE